MFFDVTGYLKTYNLSAHELAKKMILDVFETTGITATAGIGTNLYLCKIAMDIGAKHAVADSDGVRIAYLDEMSYRKTLWSHRPLTDFWRVGRGYTKKLEQNGLFTMGDIARCSLGKAGEYHNEALLYKLFGVNAELLIDHAWGWESCEIKDIKAYKPSNNSISTGQVLHIPYTTDKTRLIVREMADLLSLDLFAKGLATNQLVLTVGYDIENLRDPARKKAYKGSVTIDYYGRAVPKHAHGTINLKTHSSSTKQIVGAVLELFDRIIDENLLVRRLNISANHVVEEASVQKSELHEQLDFFTDYKEVQLQKEKEAEEYARETKMQEAIISVKRKFGKNAILKGMNFSEGATTKERNEQIGGHKS